MASPLLVLWRREADAHKVLTRITSIRLHRYHQSDYSQVGTRQQLLKSLLINIFSKTPQSWHCQLSIYQFLLTSPKIMETVWHKVQYMVLDNNLCRLYHVYMTRLVLSKLFDLLKIHETPVTLGGPRQQSMWDMPCLCTSEAKNPWWSLMCWDASVWDEEGLVHVWKYTLFINVLVYANYGYTMCINQLLHSP